MALLRGWKARAKGPFVIESDESPRYHKTSFNFYRAQVHFTALYDWLRKHGVRDSKPLHTLRKELGSILANEQGIFAAQQVLRHAHIQTTARHYADKRRFMTAGLGTMLGDMEPAAQVLTFPAPEPEAKTVTRTRRARSTA